MKHKKRWVSLLLAVMMTVAAPLSAFAAWEDGFVIPGQNSGSNSYDDCFGIPRTRAIAQPSAAV